MATTRRLRYGWSATLPRRSTRKGESIPIGCAGRPVSGVFTPMVRRRRPSGCVRAEECGVK
jgi:hypothetical protein